MREEFSSTCLCLNLNPSQDPEELHEEASWNQFVPLSTVAALTQSPFSAFQYLTFHWSIEDGRKAYLEPALILVAAS